MITYRRKSYPPQHIYDREGAVAGLQVSKAAGVVNLTTGMRDEDGFYLCVSPTGTEGLINVVLFGDETNTPVPLPFFMGFSSNPILVKAVVYSGSATATGVYWGK